MLVIDMHRKLEKNGATKLGIKSKNILLYVLQYYICHKTLIMLHVAEDTFIGKNERSLPRTIPVLSDGLDRDCIHYHVIYTMVMKTESHRPCGIRAGY